MNRFPARAASLALGLLVSACADSAADPVGEPGVSSLRWAPMTDPSGWSLVGEEEDPIPEHRPEQVACSPHPWHVVGQGIEADTGQCNYITLSTPLVGGFEVGDPLRVETWWAPLASVERARGHLALFVGGQLLWETTVDIPGPSDARLFEFDAPFSAQPDEDVVFHLHNHGFNTWNLADFSALRSPEEVP